ncbi:MAG: ABC transporter substrate-binding protein [Rhodospirillaceae bacterium]|nr:ABC transporter substrate-binding protein [Rhodospirillaceae bacterium]MBT5666836.1 ABC transporter substrate-binding protein [Rhodospirillaceae bacterium]MBT5810573.1 ABC transporter substrate-binding protein [Rhodospirillaceae bacterium]
MLERRRLLQTLGGLMLGVLCAVSPGSSATATASEASSDFVKSLGDQAIKVLTVKDISEGEREHRFRSLLRDGFDVRRIGRFVLGRYARSASAEAIKQYNQLFEDLIVVTYASRFSQYSGQSFDIKRATKPTARGDSIVLSEIVATDGSPPIRVDWQVNNAKGRYKIVDVRVEGVSMSVTQREEFTAVIRQNGGDIEALLDALRKKTVSLKSK